MHPWLAAATVVVIAGAGGVAMYRSMNSATSGGTDRIAVMPFLPSDASDTALARLGRDLVVTLTANLDGVGDLRMIDPLSVLAQTAGADARDPARMLELAQGLGARSALVGTLVRTGGKARLDYRLVPTDQGGDRSTTGIVTAPVGDEGIMALTAARGAPPPRVSAAVRHAARATSAPRGGGDVGARAAPRTVTPCRLHQGSCIFRTIS